MTLTVVKTHGVFGGALNQCKHSSPTLNCDMRFSIYLPPAALAGKKVPVLYWLSGLTCTDDNFSQKAGAQRVAAELGIAIVAPDTSPRGDHVPDVADRYDLGKGAGFYVNATQQPWRDHYQMYDYVVTELPALIEREFPVNSSKAVAGHSMGGHGALVVGLKNPDAYVSISAFSPITNPTTCQWGRDAFTQYLGTDESTWQAYDACELIKHASKHRPMLVDQGLADEFMDSQLQPGRLQDAAQANGYPLTLRLQEGYDHSYYFIASFIEDHLRFHAQHLQR